MKWSIYNELVKDENKNCMFLFNPLRGKYFILDSKLNELITKGIDNVCVIEDNHPDLYNRLVLEEFLIPDNLDEMDECVKLLSHKYASISNLRITINPTLDCNLRCWYCYESHIKGSVMSSEIQDAVIRFVEKQAHSEELDQIHLSFFGGEPLLKYEAVVKPIVKRCIEICKAYNKHFLLSFTTNGVCLTPSVTDELLDMGASFSIQVAFDGNKEIHNSVKCFANGSGCYDIVKRNLCYAIEKGTVTTIRCNYTMSNIESFIDLLKDFRDYWHYPNVRFAFHKVWQEQESKELFEKRALIKEYINKAGIKSNINSFYGNSISPCYADYDNNVVINYNGDVFKCTARDFKPQHRLGHLETSGDIIYNDVYAERKTKRLIKQCKTCRLLPICTICFQQRVESKDGNCPKPIMRENAADNIQKYFYDVVKN